MITVIKLAKTVYEHTFILLCRPLKGNCSINLCSFLWQSTGDIFFSLMTMLVIKTISWDICYNHYQLNVMEKSCSLNILLLPLKFIELYPILSACTHFYLNPPSPPPSVYLYKTVLIWYFLMSAGILSEYKWPLIWPYSPIIIPNTLTTSLHTTSRVLHSTK